MVALIPEMQTHSFSTDNGPVTVQIGMGGTYVHLVRKLGARGPQRVLMVQFDSDERITLHNVQAINVSSGLPQIVRLDSRKKAGYVAGIVAEAREFVQRARDNEDQVAEALARMEAN